MVLIPDPDVYGFVEAGDGTELTVDTPNGGVKPWGISKQCKDSFQKNRLLLIFDFFNTFFRSRIF